MKIELERRTFEKSLQDDSKTFQERIFDASQATQRMMVWIASGQALLAIVAIVIGVVLTVQCGDRDVTVKGVVPVVLQTPAAEEAP